MSDTGKLVEIWKKQADGKWKCIVDTYNSDLPPPQQPKRRGKARNCRKSGLSCKLDIESRDPPVLGQLPDCASSSSYPDGHIDDLAAQVGNVLANVVGTELVCRTVEILRQLHADVVRAWLRAPVA